MFQQQDNLSYFIVHDSTVRVLLLASSQKDLVVKTARPILSCSKMH